MSSYRSLSDDELLKHLILDDEAAFTEIYNRYWEKLVATGFYFTHNKQAAEDVVHEVMIRLWLKKKELTILSLQSYLAASVKFEVFKSILKDKRRRELLAGKPVLKNFEIIEDQLDARFLNEYLNGAIDQLPEKARLVFHYSRENELSVKEIAKLMDLSPKAVEYHMTKALRTLRNTLEKIKLLFV